MVMESINIIKYDRFIEKYNPVMEGLPDGSRQVKYYSVDDPTIKDVAVNHVWSYINWNGEYIVPGIRLKDASFLIISEKPWGIGDSGLRIEM